MKKTRVVFYARVSKDTEEQLHSFEAQKKYFEEFISRNKDMVFIRGYADEGISGVNVKKRKQFQQMIEDAKNSEFDLSHPFCKKYSGYFSQYKIVVEI